MEENFSWEFDAIRGIPARPQKLLPRSVGSKLTVKWQREQFFAVAKNCRSDGREFLLGVRRDTGHPSPPSKIASELASKLAQPELTSGAPKNLPALSEKAQSPAQQEANRKQSPAPSSLPESAPPPDATPRCVSGS